jgi:LPS-assembly protein
LAGAQDSTNPVASPPPIIASENPPVTAIPPVEIAFGEASYDPGPDRWLFTDGIELQRGAMTLRARSASYDGKTGTVDAVGDVVLIEDGRVVGAQSLRITTGGELEAQEVTAFMKEGALQLRTPHEPIEALRVNGRNRAVFSGKRLVRDGPQQLTLEDAAVTLCDCGAEPPSWEIRTRRAQVVGGKRLSLTSPVIYITPRVVVEIAGSPPLYHPSVPVLVLPWLSLPLVQRQSGLLWPKIGYSGRNGLTVGQPAYATLGPSYDVTLTPTWISGASALGTKPEEDFGVRGFGSDLELRWAPTEGARGRVELSWLYDQAKECIDGDVKQGCRRRALDPRGSRLALNGWHTQRFSERTRGRIDLGLVGDPLYKRDFTGDLLLRSLEYRRSSLTASHRRPNAVASLDVSYHLPTAEGPYFGNDYDPDDPNSRQDVPYGIFGSDLRSMHRLPSVNATLLPVALMGPLHLKGEVGVARFAPLKGNTGDEGTDGRGPGSRGFPGMAAGDAAERNGIWEEDERLAATRLGTRAELRAPILAGDFLLVEPLLRATALQYLYEGSYRTAPPPNDPTSLGRPTSDPRVDAWAVAGLVASTEVARTFRDGRVRHAIRPYAEWRLGTRPLSDGGLPSDAYDELDAGRSDDRAPAFEAGQPGAPFHLLALRPLRALPTEGFQQARVGIKNRVTMSPALFELELGQDADLRSGEMAESWGRLRAEVGPISANALASVDLFHDRPDLGLTNNTAQRGFWGFFDPLSEIQLSLMAQDRRGDKVWTRYNAVGPGGSSRLLAGIEPLFDPRRGDFAPVGLAWAGFSVRPVKGLDVWYESIIETRYRKSLSPIECENRRTPIDEPNPAGGPNFATLCKPRPIQQSVGLTWDSPCKCWRMAVSVHFREGQAYPDVFHTFELAGLGDAKR